MNIPLHSRKYPDLNAVIDDEDYELVSQYRWYPRWDKNSQSFYAMAGIKKNNKWVTMMMHRLILGLTNPKILCDHKNHNGLFNVRSNLRIVTNQQNMMNRQSRIGTSRYRGVYWKRETEKWADQIGYNKTKTHLGYFDNEIDAARIYNKKAKELFGEYAYLNNV